MEVEERKPVDKKAEANFFRADKAKEALDALAAEIEGIKAMKARIEEPQNEGGSKDAE